MGSSSWALDRISRLLPLDEESLKQILDYTSKLPGNEAAEHLKNLLGDSPQALEFISSFNARRRATHTSPPESSTSQETQGVPRAPKLSKKKKAPLNNLPPPRRPENYGDVGGGYQKRKEEEDYMPATHRQHQQRKDGVSSNPFSLSTAPAAEQAPRATLDPFLPNVPTRTASPSKSNQSSRIHTPSNTPSRTSSPRPNTAAASHQQPKQKVSIPGGTPMHGASSTISDLDSALRSLEMSTNPTLRPSEADNKARACSCMGSVHPLLTAAPNCLSCGKIICAKEGLAPCTFCDTPLLTPAQVQEMVRALREERGKEKMAANNAAQGRGGGKGPVSGPAPLANESDPALANAMAHRDKLLNYQASNAKRTQVVDEAAAFETPDMGVSQWASATERAQQLKKQQQVLREMEWNAKPEWEKRKVVVSVDLVGGKVVRRMQSVAGPEASGDDGEGKAEDEELDVVETNGRNGVTEGGGRFAKNPLLGKMVKPVWRNLEGQGNVEEAVNQEGAERRTGGRDHWRRVQDDADDNEEIILNGGVYGGRESERVYAEEPAYG